MKLAKNPHQNGDMYKKNIPYSACSPYSNPGLLFFGISRVSWGYPFLHPLLWIEINHENHPASLEYPHYGKPELPG
jgi:hypothetical protein